MPIEPDPRFITFNIQLSMNGQNYLDVPVEEIELENLNPDKHSQYFQPGSFASISI